MAEPKRQFVDGSFGQLHLRIAAPKQPTKRPLVCAHMFPQSSRNFERFLGVASNERVVVALDFPGHGESAPPTQPIAAEDYARSIWEVVDALGLLDSHQQVDLFGIHAGGKLTAEAAKQRVADVNKIVLSSAAVLYPEEVAQLKKLFKPVPLDEQGTRFSQLWDLVVKNRHADMTLEMCATAYAEMLRGGESYEWGHHAVFDFNLKFPDVLKALPHPVALLNPRDDLFEMTPRSLEYLRDATLIELPDWGLGYLESHAESLVNIVYDWLDR